MINLYKGVEIDSSYNIVYDVSSDASFLSFLSTYLKQSITEDFNFIWKTSTTAEITIDNGSLEIEEVLNFNYLVYQNDTKYYYFFITKAECNSNQSTTFTLTLDVWSTYGYRELATKNPTIYVERAHCQRFSNDSTINYTLPQLLTAEATEQTRNSVDTVNLYSHKTYLLVQIAYDTTKYDATETPSGIALPTLCVVAPIESGSSVYVPTGSTIANVPYSASGLYNAVRNKDVELNMDLYSTNKIKGTVVSISTISLPLGLTGTGIASIDNDFVKATPISLAPYNGDTVVDWVVYGMFIKKFKMLYESNTTNLSYCALKVIKYPSSPTALSKWDKQVEPKLLSYPFTSFNFIDYHKQYSDYNLYKIFGSNPVQRIYHYNVFGSGVFQDFMCFDSTNKFYGFNKQYGIGEITDYGDSLGFGTDSYAEWCRNNSTSAQTSLALSVVGGAIGVIGGAVATATGNVGIGVAGMTGGATSIASGVAKYNATKTDATNARETFNQPSNNILFSESFNVNLPHGYQIKTIGEEDRNLVSSYFYYNGYAYNSTATFIGAIESRVMFNYLKSSDPLIKSAITESEDIKNKVFDILSKGTEIWRLLFLTNNSKTIAESRGIYANYEKSICSD